MNLAALRRLPPRAQIAFLRANRRLQRAAGMPTSTGQLGVLQRLLPTALRAGTIYAAWKDPATLERIAGYLDQVASALGRLRSAQQAAQHTSMAAADVRARIADLRAGRADPNEQPG